MKKIIILLLTLITLCGCNINVTNLDNTPTKKVENYLNNYQTLDAKVLDDLDLVVAKETTLTEKQKKEYRDIIKKHYQNLSYNVKDETINGDSAIVEVEIEVTDFYKALNKDDIKQRKDFFDDGNDNEEAYNDYRLDIMKKTKDTVKYTLYLTLNKNEDNEWVLKDLTSEDEQKILGFYGK